MFVSKARPSISFSSTQSTVGNQIPVNENKNAANLPFPNAWYFMILHFNFHFSTHQVLIFFLLAWKYTNMIKWFLNTVNM